MTIILIGLALRLSGVRHGLPHMYNPDEQLYLYDGLSLPRRHLVSEFVLSGPLPCNATFCMGGLWYVLGALRGKYASPEDFLVDYRRDPSAFLICLRAVLALACAGSMPFLWMALHRRIRGCRLLLLLAMVAFNPLLVVQSHFVNGHGLAFAFAVAAYWGAIGISEGGGPMYSVLAGVGLGLATAAKGYCVYLLPTLAVAEAAGTGVGWAFWRYRPRERLAVCLAWAAASYLLAAPGLVLDPATALDNILREIRINSGAWVLTRGMSTWLYTLVVHLPNWMGKPVVVLGAMGLLMTIARPSRVDGLAATMLLYLAILNEGPNYERYSLPLALPVFVLATRCVDDVCTWALGRRSSLGVTIVALALALPFLGDALRLETMLTAPDTRTLAARWIEANVPAGSSVVCDGLDWVGGSSRFGVQIRASDAQIKAQIEDATRSGSGGRYLWATLVANRSHTRFLVHNVSRIDEPNLIAGRPPPAAATDYAAAGVDTLAMTDWDFRNALPDGGFQPGYPDCLTPTYRVVATFDPSPALRWDPLTVRIDRDGLSKVWLGSGATIHGPHVRILRLVRDGALGSVLPRNPPACRSRPGR